MLQLLQQPPGNHQKSDTFSFHSPWFTFKTRLVVKFDKLNNTILCYQIDTRTLSKLRQIRASVLQCEYIHTCQVVEISILVQSRNNSKIIFGKPLITFLRNLGTFIHNVTSRGRGLFHLLVYVRLIFNYAISSFHLQPSVDTECHTFIQLSPRMLQRKITNLLFD